MLANVAPAAIRYCRTSLLAAAVAAVPLLLGSAVWTEGNAQNSPALKLINTIPITGPAAAPTTKLYSFDISYVDPTPFPGHPGGLYYLADRSNKALDVIDIATDTLFGQIGGAGVGFTGFTPCVPASGANDCAGPDGVAAAFPCIFAGDGNSRLVTFNAAASFTTVVSSASTGGTTRVDEMALNTNGPGTTATTGQVFAINNAESPPFGTIFNYNKTTCVLSNPIKVTFNTANGVNATNGGEQPAFDPVTGAFYVSLPEINGPGDGTGITGAVVKVSTAGAVQTV